MHTTTTLILGGGFGGIAAARTLRSLLPEEHKIILIDRSSTFLVGATKTWVMLGEKHPDEVTVNRSTLIPENVEFIETEIEKIDCGNGIVITSQGEFRGDYLIIALGADLTMDSVPGLKEAAYSFYSLGDAIKLQDELREFREGEIVILIPEIPIKCPPAPYEAALMLDHHFRQLNIREKISITMCTIEPGPMPTAGTEMGAYIRSLLEERAIAYHPMKNTVSVDSENKKIVFEDGEEKSYQLLLTVPRHKAPEVITNAGLTNESGWIPVDPKTLKATVHNSPMKVYAVGDNTSISLPGRYKPDKPLVLPKAGVFAASQGIVAAKQIDAEIRGEKSADEFDGKGYCYIEMGGEKAIKGEGAFFEMPHPKMEKRSPDSEQYQDKVNWINSWLKGAGIKL